MKSLGQFTYNELLMIKEALGELQSDFYHNVDLRVEAREAINTLIQAGVSKDTLLPAIESLNSIYSRKTTASIERQEFYLDILDADWDEDSVDCLMAISVELDYREDLERQLTTVESWMEYEASSISGQITASEWMYSKEIRNKI